MRKSNHAGVIRQRLAGLEKKTRPVPGTGRASGSESGRGAWQSGAQCCARSSFPATPNPDATGLFVAWHCISKSKARRTGRGIRHETAHHQVAVSQHEIKLADAHALSAADRTLLLNYIAERVAAEQGMHIGEPDAVEELPGDAARMALGSAPVFFPYQVTGDTMGVLLFQKAGDHARADRGQSGSSRSISQVENGSPVGASP